MTHLKFLVAVPLLGVGFFPALPSPVCAAQEVKLDWLKGAVQYLVTEDERSVYDHLTTQDERDRFIEDFWKRRDPDPQTPDNEYREEFYRRVAYANENFAAGAPGWKTDRGRVYIIYGPPNRRDARPMGGRYEKPANQGGDTITTYPFEIWEYDYIPGIGNDISIEFVDYTQSGMYVLETDPNRKDVFYWRRGEMPLQRQWTRAKEVPFERMNIWAKIQAPPPLKFPKLREEVKAQVSYSDLPFEISTAFVRMSSDQYALPLTVSVDNRNLLFIGREGYFQAELQLYASVTNLTGAMVYQFDETFLTRTGDVSLPQLLSRSTYHQRIVPLAPGRYKLNVALKDANSGKLGTKEFSVWIPHVSEAGLNTSSLIYADVIQPVPAADRSDEFVLGPLKVIPNLKGAFPRRHQLGLYLEVYDLEVDQTTRKPSVEISYRLQAPDGKWITIGPDHESRFEEGHSMAVSKAIPLEGLAPGKYRVLVQVSDLLTERRCTLEGKVEVL